MTDAPLPMSGDQMPDQVLADYGSEAAKKSLAGGMLDEGVYHVQVTGCIHKPNSKNTGHILDMTFTVLEPEYSGKTIKDWPSTSEAAAWRTVPMLEAITQEPWEGRQLMLSDVQAMPGKRCMIVVTHEVDTRPGQNNKLQAKIKDFLPDDGAFSGISLAAPAPVPSVGADGAYQPM